MRGPRRGPRDTLAEAGVRRKLSDQELERRFLSGTLMEPTDTTRLALSTSLQTSLESLGGSILLDAIHAYREDQVSVDNPIEYNFFNAVAEVHRSLESSREMYRSAPGLVAQKQSQLREAVASALQRIPTSRLESTIDHFGLEDYQDYLRSVGVMDDRPDFAVAGSEGNLQPILNVLRDAAFGMRRGRQQRVRTINGFQVVVDDIPEGPELDEFECVHQLTRSTKATQTVHGVNDRSFLAEVSRQAAEVSELHDVLRSQEKQLAQWDGFHQTVLRRISLLAEEAHSMSREREAELHRLVTLLVHATHENEHLRQQLSAVALQKGLGTIYSDIELVRERKKIARSFAAALEKAKGQRRVMEGRIEALERCAMEQMESWAGRLDVLQSDLNALQRGFIGGKVEDAIDSCEDRLHEITHEAGGPGGMDAVRVMDEIAAHTQAEQRASCETAAERVFRRIDTVTVFASRTAVDLVRNRHRQAQIVEALSKVASLVTESRQAVADCMVAVVRTLGRELQSLHLRHEEQRAELEQRLQRSTKTYRSEAESAQRQLAAAWEEVLRLRTRPEAVEEGVMTVPVVNIQPGPIEGEGASSSSPPLVAASPTHSKGVQVDLTPEEGQIADDQPKQPSTITLQSNGPPLFRPKGKLYDESHLTLLPSAALVTAGVSFLSELAEEARGLATHIGCAAPTRVQEIAYVVSLLRQLGTRCASHENAPNATHQKRKQRKAANEPVVEMTHDWSSEPCNSNTISAQESAPISLDIGHHDELHGPDKKSHGTPSSRSQASKARRREPIVAIAERPSRGRGNTVDAGLEKQEKTARGGDDRTRERTPSRNPLPPSTPESKPAGQLQHPITLGPSSTPDTSPVSQVSAPNRTVSKMSSIEASIIGTGTCYEGKVDPLRGVKTAPVGSATSPQRSGDVRGSATALATPEHAVEAPGSFIVQPTLPPGDVSGVSIAVLNPSERSDARGDPSTCCTALSSCGIGNDATSCDTTNKAQAAPTIMAEVSLRTPRFSDGACTLPLSDDNLTTHIDEPCEDASNNRRGVVRFALGEGAAEERESIDFDPHKELRIAQSEVERLEGELAAAKASISMLRSVQREDYRGALPDYSGVSAPATPHGQVAARTPHPDMKSAVDAHELTRALSRNRKKRAAELQMQGLIVESRPLQPCDGGSVDARPPTQCAAVRSLSLQPPKTALCSHRSDMGLPPLTSPPKNPARSSSSTHQEVGTLFEVRVDRLRASRRAPP